MAKLEFEAECLCGGKVKAAFKKPTRFEHSVERSSCDSCRSEFMFFCRLDYNENGRLYITSHELLSLSEKLSEKINSLSKKKEA